MIDRLPLQQLRCLLLDVDADGVVVDAVGGLDRVAGYEAADFVGRHVLDFVAPSDHEVLAQVFLPPPEGVPTNHRPVPFELMVDGADGVMERVDVLPTAFADEDGRHWIVSLTPRRLRSPAHRLADVLLDGGDLRSVAAAIVEGDAVDSSGDDDQSSIDVFVVTDAGTSGALVVSSGAHPDVDRALLYESTHREFVSHHREGVIRSTLTSDVGGEFAGACRTAGLHAAHIGSATSSDGVIWWVVWLLDDPAFALKMLNADIPRLEALRVISYALERDRIERDLRTAAVTDSLTGLQNRRSFADRVESIATSSGDAVLFLDLDRFKVVNDTYGHHVGDAVLSEVGRRIGQVCGAEHLGARIGGDEFAILMQDASSDSVDHVAAHLEAEIGRPVDTPAGAISIAVTVGVATSAEGTDLVELLRRADRAMLAGKRPRDR